MGMFIKKSNDNIIMCKDRRPTSLTPKSATPPFNTFLHRSRMTSKFKVVIHQHSVTESRPDECYATYTSR